MAAHQVKAKQNKAKKPVAVAKAKGAKLKALHKSGSLPKRKPSVAMKPLAATRPLARKARPAGHTQALAKTKPLVKTQVKPVPRHDAKAKPPWRFNPGQEGLSPEPKSNPPQARAGSSRSQRSCSRARLRRRKLRRRRPPSRPSKSPSKSPSSRRRSSLRSRSRTCAQAGKNQRTWRRGAHG